VRFQADLHIHSKYSRATSKDLDLEHLAWWAARKGIAVIATGDCVHPAWLAELKSKLVAAEPGLFRLKPDIEAEIAAMLPTSCRSLPRFMLAVEISTIYKKGERTRKIHHLIYAPDFATVDRLAGRLARIGNIASDGRPILGLDSRDLLEITLEAGPDAYLVPAHIWTPWFAALGSQSGFDSIAECYGDLAPHIFAVETGLSSDPAMNWRVSALDRYRLTSNSDAHSPGKLGREATMFDCAHDYFAIRRALETGEGYIGTVEFFPEEGKYHLDGHRKCGVRFQPTETLAHGGRCPVCGEALTVGVAHRVEALADRSEAEAVLPPSAGEIASLVPLPEVLGEIAGRGPSSKAVVQNYDRVVAALGPELSILSDMPDDTIELQDPLLAEAVRRLRAGKVIREAGFDGEYGTIRVFEEGELQRLRSGGLLFDAPSLRPKKPERRKAAQTQEDGASKEGTSKKAATPNNLVEMPRPKETAGSILAALDADQQRAAAIVEGPLLIVAGPGSGKTRTLTHRIAHLVTERGVSASACLAITFTRRAAAEMRERLARLLPAGAADVPIHTFHSLGLELLRAHAEAVGLAPDFKVVGDVERTELLAAALDTTERKVASLLARISRLKRTRQAGEGELAEALAAYDRGMRARHWLDFDDLVGLTVTALESDPGLLAHCRERFRVVSVDEFQDVDEQQYRLLQSLVPPDGNLCVIGDRDQAIYGFRGADAQCFDRFRADFPSAVTVSLTRNYRSTGTIVMASSQVIATAREESPAAAAVRGWHERIAIHTAPTERAEAEFVVSTIERLIGGTSLLSIDTGRARGGGSNLAFSDFAVLYRTDAQSEPIAEAFARSGIPFKKGSHSPLIDQPAVRRLMAALDGTPTDALLPDRVATAAEQVRRDDGGDVASAAMALSWLTALAEGSGGNLARFREAVSLAIEADFLDPRADRVSLLTMHAAKGLEFPVVFVVGLEDGIMPLRFGARDDAAEAEERRLLYVAMTRAGDRLFLSRAVARQWRGRLRQLDASPFLTDIEAQLVKHHRAELPRRKPEDRQLQLL
jgi:ATP-dependent DNA helicase UvrD/PcrA